MEFFNKKEEVIDLKLTQFGKNLLARGLFKPVYYQFFDDDIIYNSEIAGFVESQNDSEKRIIQDTVRLKTQHNTFGVENSFHIEQEQIDKGERPLYNIVSKNVDPFVQDRILLYPLGSQEVANQNAPRFLLRALDEKFEPGVTYLNLTGAGIRKNIPQLSMSSSFILSEHREETTEPSMLNSETFVDLTSKEVTFLDQSKIKIYGNSVLLDLEEFNVFFGSDNFELEIYEVTTNENKEILNKIDNLNEINKLFHIKTDEDVTDVKVKTKRKSNYHRTDEK